ncbi:hypothetical protein [Xanthomonas sp. MUS 060]|uniref:hypothetical protein n=1 Tax=Xanthomonas sp. MUS 060 TaxID=1588031 RepID=UPI0005F2B567|nr:hypothetical protein [Xanthomonas sp. MUS 060]
MTASPPIPREAAARGRWPLIALFVLFFGSMLAAGVLRFSGWQPPARRNHGELLTPPADLRALQPRLADGSLYAWRPQQRLWRIALAPPAECASVCDALARELDKVWQLFGHDADHVQILWIGTPSPWIRALPPVRVLRADPALLAALPRAHEAAGVPVYVIDPNGFVVLRYAPGFDPAGLRSDLAKLLKLL